MLYVANATIKNRLAKVNRIPIYDIENELFECLK